MSGAEILDRMRKPLTLSYRGILPIIVAAALAVPIALPQVLNYETNLAFLLAPLAVWSFVTRWNSENTLFMIAGTAGLCSIGIAAKLYPDGRLWKDVLSLVLLTYPAAFFFLGRRFPSTKRIVYWLAVFSALFLIPVAFRILLNGETVRATSPDDFSILNARFFSLPVFASFGVNALAHLICIQATLICGALLSALRGTVVRLLLYVGLACGVFLIVGSDSRSAQLYLIVLAVILAWNAVQKPHLRPKFIAVFAMLLIGVAFGIRRMPSDSRLVQTIDTVAQMEHVETTVMTKPGETGGEFHTSVDSLTSGRAALATLALKEFASSPIYGSGFSPFGRYTTADPSLRLSATSHVYYLTAFWKGGLLFGVPFMVFLFVAAKRMIAASKWRDGPMEFYATLAVVLTFGLISFTYDTPNVPSAGALVFLLLGSLGTQRLDANGQQAA